MLCRYTTIPVKLAYLLALRKSSISLEHFLTTKPHHLVVAMHLKPHYLVSTSCQQVVSYQGPTNLTLCI